MSRCPVCGFAETHDDAVEVEDGGVLFLAECPRCEHRWTSRALPCAPGASRMVPVRVPLRVTREAASAA